MRLLPDPGDPHAGRLAELYPVAFLSAWHVEELRDLARDPLSAMGHVQIVLRLGHGPQGPMTPRRRVRDVLDIA